MELITMGTQMDPAAEFKRLSRILDPATDEDAAAAISFMFKILPIANVEDDESLSVVREGYRLALRGYPKWAILEARDAFIAGRVEGYTSSFAPNPADLGREIGRRVADYQNRLARARKQAGEQKALGTDNREPTSEAVRAEVAERIQKMKAVAEDERSSLRAFNGPDLSAYYVQRADPPSKLSRPLTPEDVAGIPDAPPRGTGSMQPVGSAGPFRSSRMIKEEEASR
ncbi:MAG: hypothetical protein ABJE71_07570 [Nitratireductor sp.]